MLCTSYGEIKIDWRFCQRMRAGVVHSVKQQLFAINIAVAAVATAAGADRVRMQQEQQAAADFMRVQHEKQAADKAAATASALEATASMYAGRRGLGPRKR